MDNNTAPVQDNSVKFGYTNIPSPSATVTPTNPNDEIAKFEKIADQYEFRKEAIVNFLKENNIGVKDVKLIACISSLPFEPNNIIIDDGKDEDADKKELISALWKYEFLIPKEK